MVFRRNLALFQRANAFKKSAWRDPETGKNLVTLVRDLVKKILEVRLKMRIVAVPRNRLNAFKKNGGALLNEVSAREAVECRVNEDGNIEIECGEKGNPGSEWIAEQVLRALALGFEPKQAFKLFGDDFFLEVLDLELLLSKSEKRLTRMKSRVIGSEGRVKKNIEEFSGAFVSVTDNSVALLGKYEDLKLAKAAVGQLLEGREISTVYAFLERHSKEK